MSDATMTDADEKAARIRLLLRQFGVDVNRACDLNFNFYFPRKTFCEAAASRLQWLGFAVSLTRTNSGPTRSVAISRGSINSARATP